MPSSGTSEYVHGDAAAARLLGINPATLARLRADGDGPPHRMLRRRRVYLVSELHEWLEGRREGAA